MSLNSTAWFVTFNIFFNHPSSSAIKGRLKRARVPGCGASSTSKWMGILKLWLVGRGQAEERLQNHTPTRERQGFPLSSDLQWVTTSCASVSFSVKQEENSTLPCSVDYLEYNSATVETVSGPQSAAGGVHKTHTRNDRRLLELDEALWCRGWITEDVYVNCSWSG